MVDFTQECIDHIKKKKELSLLDDSFVKKTMDEVPTPDLSKYDSFAKALRNKKVKEYVRSVRAKLRTVYGLFVTEPVTEKEVATMLWTDERAQQVLQRHRSTQERAPYYQQFYDKLCLYFKKYAIQNYRLLDVACGYNPFALQFFACPPRDYVAVDLSSEEMRAVQTFFTQQKVAGSAFGMDVLSEEFQKYLQSESFDVVFLLKALDSFESVKRHSSKKLLSALQAKLLVVSFPLLSIGGGACIAADRRGWFERFCEKEGWNLNSFELPNELVYVVSKDVTAFKV